MSHWPRPPGEAPAGVPTPGTQDTHKDTDSRKPATEEGPQYKTPGVEGITQKMANATNTPSTMPENTYRQEQALERSVSLK